MHFYPACSVPSPGERMCVRDKENKPHVTDIVSLVQCTPRSYSTTVVLMAIHDLTQKEKVALGKLL